MYPAARATALSSAAAPAIVSGSLAGDAVQLTADHGERRREHAERRRQGRDDPIVQQRLIDLMRERRKL